MALKPKQQEILDKMRTGIPLYYNRQSGGFYLQHAKGMAIVVVGPFTVMQLLRGKHIEKDLVASGGASSWLDCYRPVGSK